MRFITDPALEDAPPANKNEKELKDATLRSFEEMVTDDKGIWVYFDKVVP
mgnify:CR=1 FL=1